MMNSQRHFGTCSIVAVRNAVEWARAELINYQWLVGFCKRFEFLTKYPEYNNALALADQGHAMARLLRHFDVSCRARHGITMGDLDHELDRGNSVILVYSYPRDGGRDRQYRHAAFVESRDEEVYKVWNAGEDVPEISREQMAQYMRYTNQWDTNGRSTYGIIIPRRQK